jgi:hypothetical protein
MGQEITTTRFNEDDAARFHARLLAETRLLGDRLAAGDFCDELPLVAGCEIEGWLLDRHYFPVADNEPFLARLGDPLVVPELSRYNIEINCEPVPLCGGAFGTLQAALAATWERCQRAAHAGNDVAMLIGILPTLRERDLDLANISPLNRYRALNAQIMRARGGTPIRIDIRGRECLQLAHDDAMLEAATTSLQLHLQVPAARAVRYYHAAQLLAAPMVAVAANAPFLFGRDLWAETRVPLFEQAVATAPSGDGRVTFGHDWLTDGPAGYFEDNLDRYPPLLPLAIDDPPDSFSHLRLHNGTIWRWNRLLVGAGPRPTLRLEHRVMAAGPSFLDMLANAALFFGAVNFLASLEAAPERSLPFPVARANFYEAARDGLDAGVEWLDRRRLPVATLIDEELVPMAREGLRQLELEPADTESLLDIVRQRARSRRNGTWWQRAWLARHPGDFAGLTARYVEHQRAGNPVHEWEI